MVKQLKEHLALLGHEVFIFTGAHPKSHFEENVFRFRSFPFPWERQHRVVIPTVYFDVEKTLEKLQIDLIHSHTMLVMGYIGNIIAERKSIPSVTTYHTIMEDYVHYIPFFNSVLREFVIDLSRRFCNKNKAVIVPSRKVEKLLRDYGVSTDIEVIPNGIDLTPFENKISEEKIQEFRERFNIPSNAKVLIFVGRLGKEKSVDAIVENFSRIVKKYPDTFLLIVGDGPEKKNLKTQVKELGLKNRVIFTGYLKWPDEVVLAYNSSDIFVIASHTETFGVVLVEAMACGLPVVAYADDAFRDIVKNGINGFLIGSKDRLHEGIESLLSSDELMKNMSVASIEIAGSFTMEKHVKKTIALYETVLNSRD
jgi:1,2-diacylglycerol 3-alpha-glucosyltransferase